MSTNPHHPSPDPAATPSETPSIHHLEAQRRANRQAVIDLGLSPYGNRRDGLISLAEARRRYNPDADAAHQSAGKQPPPDYTDKRPLVSVAGRIVLLRDGGKLVWLTLRDNTGDLQIAVSKADADETSFSLIKNTDLSDIVIATGPLMKTRTGEITVWAKSIEPAAKSLAPPPEKHAGLHDVEQRYRRRYVDLWASPDAMRVFAQRSRIISRMRRFLDERDYAEVETPVLQQLAGGAAARPFTTHMNALDIDLFLRIAPELYLKRLLVGGMPRVYEVARNFRNEGLDRSHNPEFTMVEVYQAYGNYETMMELTESLVRELASMVVMDSHDESAVRGAAPAASEDHIAGAADPSELRLPFGDLSIDFGSPFRRVTYAELFEQALGFPMTDTAKARAEADRRGFKTTNDKGQPLDDILVVGTLFDEVAEKGVDPSRPTFIIDYPTPLCPLTRPKVANPVVAERFELFIGGMEMANAYTELNDPDVQEAKFREQLAGIDDEQSTFRTFDQDFVDALKVGMPPAGGLGIGIDRLCMVLTNQRSIRDVLLFPMMRPLAPSPDK